MTIKVGSLVRTTGDFTLRDVYGLTVYGRDNLDDGNSRVGKGDILLVLEVLGSDLMLLSSISGRRGRAWECLVRELT